MGVGSSGERATGSSVMNRDHEQLDVTRAEVRRLCDKYGNEYWQPATEADVENPDSDSEDPVSDSEYPASYIEDPASDASVLESESDAQDSEEWKPEQKKSCLSLEDTSQKKKFNNVNSS